MATTSQPHHYIGPPSVNGNLDILNRILIDLCTCDIHKEGASLALKNNLEEEARDLSNEAFSRFMDQLYDRNSSHLESSDVTKNIEALMAINELIDVMLGENASKVGRVGGAVSVFIPVIVVREDAPNPNRHPRRREDDANSGGLA